MTDRSGSSQSCAGGVLAGATPGGREHGLERWWDPVENDAMFWLAPAGSTVILETNGEGADAVELRWSELSAQVPSVRAVVLLDGPGFDDPGADFTFAHSVAEDVARFAGERSGIEAGAIEILVFRPDPARGPWPRPTRTADGAEFRFPHRGGADVRVTVTIPATAQPDTTIQPDNTAQPVTPGGE